MPNPLVYDDTDFTTSSGVVDMEQLRQEFAAASFPNTPVVFSHADGSGVDSAPFSVFVHFDDIPNGADEAIADAIIAAHDATGPEEPDPGTEPPAGGVTLAESWRFDTGTADADPGSRKFRFDNATQGSATFIYVNKTSDGGVDFGALLLLLKSGAAVYVQENQDSTRYHLFTLTGDAVDATTYVKLPVSAEDSGVDLRSARICGFVFHTAGGGGTVFTPTILPAKDLLAPFSTDWAIDEVAGLISDSNNPGIKVWRFDDTTPEGVGLNPILIPSGATNITISFKSRAETAPPAARTVGIDFYRRAVPDNGAAGAWSAATQLTDIDIPANENWQYDSQTITLASLSITAGQLYQFEFVRVDPSGGTELAADWTLAEIRVEFS